MSAIGYAVLVSGAGGYIGSALLRAFPGARGCSHDAVPRDPSLLDGVDLLIHAGRDPRLGTDAWTLEADVELEMARLAAARGIRQILLSSRKVYGEARSPIPEAAPARPSEAYGAQKLAVEQALTAIQGERLTILRLANIIGYEPGRQTFMGFMLDRLAALEEIRFDMAPATARDFLPVDKAAEAIMALAARPPGGAAPGGAIPGDVIPSGVIPSGVIPSGVINVGSGLPLATGDVARALIAGFGTGRLVVTDTRIRDAFVLDVARLHSLTGLRTTRDEILAAAHQAGAELRARQPVIS